MEQERLGVGMVGVIYSWVAPVLLCFNFRVCSNFGAKRGVEHWGVIMVLPASYRLQSRQLVIPCLILEYERGVENWGVIMVCSTTHQLQSSKQIIHRSSDCSALVLVQQRSGILELLTDCTNFN